MENHMVSIAFINSSAVLLGTSTAASHLVHLSTMWNIMYLRTNTKSHSTFSLNLSTTVLLREWWGGELEEGGKKAGDSASCFFVQGAGDSLQPVVFEGRSGPIWGVKGVAVIGVEGDVDEVQEARTETSKGFEGSRYEVSVGRE